MPIKQKNNMNLIALHMNRKEPEWPRRKVKKILSYRMILCLISIIAKELENASGDIPISLYLLK